MDAHDKVDARRGAPTLRDVAAVAGVSIWTASTTYGKPERVAPATRQRVHDAARRLGYRGPHPAARSLARGRTGMIAFVSAGDADALLGDPAASQVARGLLAACDRGGYSLVLSAQAANEAVDGRVFLHRTPEHDGRVPVVVVDGDAGEDVVNADAAGAGAAAAHHLYALGHRHVAVLAWEGGHTRLRGAERAWTAAPPLTVHLASGPEPRPTAAMGEALARAALERSPRPTALLALSDVLALRALETAHWIGLRVPDDVSVIGIDDLPEAQAIGLSSVMVPYRPMGERAGELLIARCEGRAPHMVTELPTVLAARRTTAPPHPQPGS